MGDRCESDALAQPGVDLEKPPQHPIGGMRAGALEIAERSASPPHRTRSEEPISGARSGTWREVAPIAPGEDGADDRAPIRGLRIASDEARPYRAGRRLRPSGHFLGPSTRGLGRDQQREQDCGRSASLRGRVGEADLNRGSAYLARRTPAKEVRPFHQRIDLEDRHPSAGRDDGGRVIADREQPFSARDQVMREPAVEASLGERAAAFRSRTLHGSGYRGPSDRERSRGPGALSPG